MTALRIASRLFGLSMACTLLMCGALCAMVGVPWLAAVCFGIGMWEGR